MKRGRFVVVTTRVMLVAIICASVIYFVARPVCVPLAPDDRAWFDVPLEQRTDRDFYVRVFQLRNGQWHQCKTWVSRQLFF